MQTEIESDISVKLSKFFLKNVGLWKAKDHMEEYKMKLLNFYTTWNVVIGVYFQFRDVYFTWFFHGDILYVCSNCLSVLISSIKLIVIVVHKVEFMNLIDYMYDHFWNADYDFHEKRILQNCRNTCVYFTSCVSTIGICVIISYLAAPFIGRIPSNSSERTLPFDMWLNLPMSETPYYETMFGIQVLTVYFVAVCYFCFDNVFCIMSLHLSSQFRILQYRLTKLVDVKYQSNETNTDSVWADYAVKSYKQFKNCVRHHQELIDYCEKLENVYTTIILAQVLLFSVLICLFGYQILLANGTHARRSLFIFLISGAMVLLFMFTYSCHMVIEQSENIAVGAYSALWTCMPMNQSGKSFRKDLIIVMERSRRVCCLTANGFFPVSLETYTTILSTAMSYFTLLKNNTVESVET
ncbi:Odorant receptor 4 [Anthophora plagiata]